MTVDKQPRALYLADGLEKLVPFSLRRDLEPTLQAASELRRLHALNHELLEALQAMLEVHGVTQGYADKHIEIPQSWVEVSDIARAAIAKATGETK